MRWEVSRGAGRGPGAVACLLQELPAVGAEHSGGLSSRGTARGRGTRAPVTTPGFWADRSGGVTTVGPGVVSPADVGPQGGQPCGCRAPGWSALRTSGPRVVGPVDVGLWGGRLAPGWSALWTSSPGVVGPVDVGPWGGRWAPGWSALRTSGPRVVSPADVACRC